MFFNFFKEDVKDQLKTMNVRLHNLELIETQRLKDQENEHNRVDKVISSILKRLCSMELKGVPLDVEENMRDLILEAFEKGTLNEETLVEINGAYMKDLAHIQNQLNHIVEDLFHLKNTIADGKKTSVKPRKTGAAKNNG